MSNEQTTSGRAPVPPSGKRPLAQFPLGLDSIDLAITGATAELADSLMARAQTRWPKSVQDARTGMPTLVVDVDHLDEDAAWYEVATQIILALAAAHPGHALPGVGGRDLSRRGFFAKLGLGAPAAAPQLWPKVCQLAFGCRTCVEACDEKALSVNDNGRLTLDFERCSSCGHCLAACPVGALSQPPASQIGVDAVLGEMRHHDADRSNEPRRTHPVAVFTCDPTPRPPAPWVTRITVADVGAVGPRWLAAASALGATVHVWCVDGQCRGRAYAQAAVATIAAIIRDDGPPVRYYEGPALNQSETVVRPASRPKSPLIYSPVVVHRPIDQHAPKGSAGIEPPPAVKDDTWEAYADAIARIARPDAAVLGLGFTQLNVAETCTSCGACVNICQRHAISLDETRLTFRAAACSGCGACVSTCPEHVITLQPSDKTIADLDRPETVHLDETVHCVQCGQPIGSRVMLARVAKLLGRPTPDAATSQLCTNCRATASQGTA